jgi:hypothetical protein
MEFSDGAVEVPWVLAPERRGTATGRFVAQRLRTDIALADATPDV